MILFISQVSTMLVIGLWHGITWNFVIWGAWHGLGCSSTTAGANYPAMADDFGTSSALEAGRNGRQHGVHFHLCGVGLGVVCLPTPVLALQVFGEAVRWMKLLDSEV